MKLSRLSTTASLLLFSCLAIPGLLCAGNNPPYAMVHVTVVPQYVYANATYWVPVTFHIDGLGNHVIVKPGFQILFYVDGTVLSPFPVTDPPFAAQNGRAAQDNGLFNTYTAWISSTAVMNKLLNGKPDTVDCWFKVIGDFQNADNGDDPGQMESPRDSNSSPKAFSDNRVAVAEIKKTTVFKPGDDTQQVFEASHDGSIDTHLTQVAEIPLQVPTLLQPASFPSYGFAGETQGHIYGITGNRANVIPSAFGSHLTLDGGVNLGPSVSTLRMQSTAQSFGLYWGNSYGFIVPLIISPEKGMALEQNSSGSSLDALPDSVETIATVGPNTGIIEFAPKEDLPKAMEIINFILAPEEWAIVETASMLVESKELLEKAGVLGGGTRTANINFRHIITIARDDGGGRTNPIEVARETSSESHDVSSTTSGRFGMINLGITAGSTTHYQIELDNGIECTDFGLNGSFLDSDVSFNYGTAGVTVFGQ